MISAPVVITGRSSRRYTTSAVPVEACPTRWAISSMLTPRWLMTLTNDVRSSRGVQPSPIPATLHTRFEHLPDVPRVEGSPEIGASVTSVDAYIDLLEC